MHVAIMYYKNKFIDNIKIIDTNVCLIDMYVRRIYRRL